MGQGQTPVKPRVWGMLFVVGLFILLMFYGTILIASRDPFWFLSGFNELPAASSYITQASKLNTSPGSQVLICWLKPCKTAWIRELRVNPELAFRKPLTRMPTRNT